MRSLHRLPSGCSTVRISFGRIWPAGMPVQPATTSATAWRVDHRIDQRLSRPAARAASPSAPPSSSRAARPCPRPSAGSSIDRRAVSAISATSRFSCSQRASQRRRVRPRRSARSVSSSARARAVIGSPVGALALEDRRPRCRSARCAAARSSIGGGIAAWLIADARAGGVEQADRLVRQLARRDVAGRQPHRLARPPRRGCARCGASRASRPGRAASRSPSAPLGSSTFTTWKRRVSAASFSKYFLYSAQVVAAIVRSSPRASAGFSRLAASPCPAAPPAPISVCASSMNRMIGVGRGLHFVDHRLAAGSRTRPSRRRRPAAGRGRACAA